MALEPLGAIMVRVFLHPRKTWYPILFTLFGIVTDVRLEQSLKAEFPILVTLFGIVTEVRLEQSLKAKFPILVTLFGIVTAVSLLHR